MTARIALFFPFILQQIPTTTARSRTLPPPAAMPMMAPMGSPPSSLEVGGGGAKLVESVTVLVMVGTASTVMPSAALATEAVPRLEETVLCTAATVVVAGTAMVAVMITEAAVTLMVTSDASTPAAVAILCRRPEVSA